MNFDPLSFVIGKHGDSGPVRDVESYLIGRVVGTAGEIWRTLTNVAVASFTAVSAMLRELVVDITPVQSGSGDPAPDNVRPISGWTGANIVVSPTLDAQDGTTYAVSWQTAAGTVYGGMLTWLGNNQWKLTRTHRIITILSSDGDFTFYSNPNRVTIRGYITDYNRTVINRALCDRFVPIANADTGSILSENDNGFNFNTIARYPEIRFNMTGLGFSTVDEFKQYLDEQNQAGAPLTVCYELATPIEYTLTVPDSEIKTLLGQNNIFADCGNINTITYRER